MIYGMASLRTCMHMLMTLCYFALFLIPKADVAATPLNKDLDSIFSVSVFWDKMNSFNDFQYHLWTFNECQFSTP